MNRELSQKLVNVPKAFVYLIPSGSFEKVDFFGSEAD
jgi:hypothetical protein